MSESADGQERVEAVEAEPVEASGQYLESMIDTMDEDRILPVTLTKEERLELGENISRAIHRRGQAEEELAVIKEKFKATLSDLEKTINLDAGTLRRGHRDGKVRVRVIKDYREGIVRVVRCDTHEEIENRPMSTQEKQMGMKL